MKFEIESKFSPKGSQPEAIEKLTKGLKKYSAQTLLGITGSGKTFTVANVIKNYQKPTLVLAHNKTLAGQLYQELKKLFPKNRVEYFISYYDYYQPESYIPTSDTYIEKEATVNQEIEKMRLKAISSLLSRDDTIVVASISCIYGAGNPQDFKDLSLEIKKSMIISREKIINYLVNMLYQRNNSVLESGNFRVRGDIIDIFPPYSDRIIRIEMFDDEIEKISELDCVSLEKVVELDKIRLFPSKQFVVTEDNIKNSIEKIKEEVEARAEELGFLEAQRLRKKVKYDIEMIEEMGYCTGIENYSRYFDNRKAGSAPFVLLDYFPEDFLLVIDESHQTIPQSHAMFKGDYSRKKNLVDFGFRLPSAFDNRPLKFEEFEKYFRHTIFVSATPADYEIEMSGQVVEQIIRPTGLLDPLIEVRKSDRQIRDLICEIEKEVEENRRVLVTTLTKRMAEDLTDFFAREKIKVRYMHSDIDVIDRIELIRQLRVGDFDVLVGINLLREGLDIPEVSLVAVLDADKEGFLRNQRSLIQTIGRAARNSKGRVLLYADRMTLSMEKAIEVTKLRREKQIEFNKEHNIVPRTIVKSVESDSNNSKRIKGIKHLSKVQVERKLIELESLMKKSAQSLDFEKAIEFRDEFESLKKEFERS